jgi:hypothetical protein
MKNLLIIATLFILISCSTSGYTPIKETQALKELRLELKEEMENSSYLGYLPQIDPPDFEYKLENRIFANLYFSENGLFFEEKFMTNDEFEETLFKLKEAKIKETKNNKGLWIYTSEDGDTNPAYFIDALIIIRKLDMCSRPTDPEYLEEWKKRQSQQ